MNAMLRQALLAATMIGGAGPLAAQAQSRRPESAASPVTAAEARIAALETAVAELKAQLAEARAAPSAARPEIAHAPAAAPATAAASSRGITLAGTSIKIGGFLKAYASVSRYSGGVIPANATGRDFYVPGSIPVGGVSEGESFEAHVKQTRMVISTDTPIAGHSLKGWIEFDFQASPGAGNQRMTNAYNLGLRRAYISYDRLLIGQDWSNFQYVGALPESTDYLGPSEGTVFVRQVQLRYSAALGSHATLSLAAENPATTIFAAGSAAMTELSSDRVPDFTARLNLGSRFGEFSLAGLVRELSATDGAASGRATGWGISFGGKIPLAAAGRHDLRFMISHGEGAGRYIGLNLAPDAILAGSGGTMRLAPVNVTAGFAALKLGWTSRLRSTFMGSAQRISYPAGLAFAGATRAAWSVSANLFYSPVPSLDFGVELRHGERELVSSATGNLDRLETVAKLNF